MTSNPFDDENSVFLVLRNTEAQYSLWPQHMPVPQGWDTVHGPGRRVECLAYIERNWTDMRPAGLARGSGR